MNSKFSCVKTKILSIVLAVVLLFGAASVVVTQICSSAGVALAKSAKESKPADPAEPNDLTTDSEELYLPNYDTDVITKGNLPKPTVTTFGAHEASFYPSYLNKLSKDVFTEARKAEILAENIKILDDAKAMFENGTLKDKLQKHVSADGQFSAVGNFDNAPRIEKVVTVNSKIAARKRSLSVFAPAGEVLTVTIDESLVKAGLTLNIGYPYTASDVGSDNVDRWPNDRMARFTMEFKLTQTVTYVGSPLGGMVTLNGVNSNLGNFNVTVSGGIDMPDYKLGVSTKDDWDNILAAPAPYVWLLTPHQYLVMPKAYISDVEDPHDALLWWHKASMISIYGVGREQTSHFTTPVISIYDSYVFIGEAVATVWAFYTNCPNSWCKGALDYDSLMNNGAWGALHEYNHHHQAYVYNSSQWGVGYVDEMTNNVLNAACYLLLTDIASNRADDKMLNGWSVVSDPFSNYYKLRNESAKVEKYEDLGTNKLFGLIDLMHNFGVAKFLDFIRAMYGLVEVDGYDGTNLTEDNYLTTQDGFALFASLYFKADFTDYFTNVWHFEISDDVAKQIKKLKFDKYFSLSNLYSVGVAGMETGRPYKVSATEPTVLRLDEFTLCSGNECKLTKVSNPKYGTLTKNDDGTYTYTPGKKFVNDSFELTYKVKVDKKTYKRTLVVKLISNEAASEQETKFYPAFVDFRNKYLNVWYSDVITVAPVEAKCVDNDGNDVKAVNGTSINNMFDGNVSTGFHTAWQGAMTAYPHNYYFTFEDEARFNSIKFTFQNNGTKGYYSIGEYEIYTSNDGVDYKLLTQGNNTETNFNVLFDDFVSAKYVKLVVKSNAAGKGFTNILELAFAQGLNAGENYNVYSSSEEVFDFEEDKWTDVSGNFLNSTAKHTQSGKVSFYVTGTNFMLYSTNAESKITVDGKTYVIKENRKNYTPSFMIAGLKNKRHLVVIEGNDMTLDMLKVTNAAPVKADTSVNWKGMSVAIVLSVAFVATLAVFIVVNVKQKKKES